MSYLTSVKTINGGTSGFYEYPIKYVATSAEATDNDTLYVLTGNSMGDIVPTLYFKHIDPYNPLGLPPNTVRVRTSDGNVPYKESYTSYETATLVPGTTDVYDVYKSGTNFTDFLEESYNVVEILGANTTGITNMGSMFFMCTSLTNIPLFDTSSVTNMNYMFNGCTNVQSGALALYQQASTQTNPPTNHSQTFTNCGKNTTTGAEELAQIPGNWK